jgi:hypothetical protein
MRPPTLLWFLLSLSACSGSSGGNNTTGTEAEAAFSWSLDEGTGTLAADSGSSGATALVQGATWIPGMVNSALGFNGSGDFVEVAGGTPAGLAGLDEGTLMLWFRFEAVPGMNEIQPLFYCGDGIGGAGNSSLILEVGHFATGSRLFFTIATENNEIPQCFDTDIHLDTGRWYHFAAVVDRDASAGPNQGSNTGYLDGVELTARHYNFGDATTAYFFDDIVSPTVTWFGRGFLGSVPAQQNHLGAIDEVLILDQPLSAAVIAAYYEATSLAMLAIPATYAPGELQLTRRVATAFGTRLELELLGASPGVPYELLLDISDTEAPRVAAAPRLTDALGLARWSLEVPIELESAPGELRAFTLSPDGRPSTGAPLVR